MVPLGTFATQGHGLPGKNGLGNTSTLVGLQYGPPKEDELLQCLAGNELPSCNSVVSTKGVYEAPTLNGEAVKRVAIVQSNYIPWKGYFDMIAAVDEFIIYDDMQFTKNDWRNRNKIKTPQGIQWLSIPVGQDIGRRIRDVTLEQDLWQGKHWRTLEANYRRAPFFDEVAAWLRPLYLGERYTHLSQVNRLFIQAVCSYLGVKTAISNSWDYRLVEGKTERVVDLCVQAGAHEYVSGPAAKSYLDESVFQMCGVKLTWFDYSGYAVYPQLWGEFVHGVSMLDVLFNCGKGARAHLRSLGAD